MSDCNDSNVVREELYVFSHVRTMGEMSAKWVISKIFRNKNFFDNIKSNLTY